MKTLIITGITGSLGKALLKEFYGKYRIIGISRNEYAQWKLKREYPNVVYMLADIRNVNIPECDYLISTAAMKHVSNGMDNIKECIDININGTINLINQAIVSCKKRFIHVSSDKAIEPINTYGATKFINEQMIYGANKHKNIFNIVRFGNLLGSSGSVTEILKEEKGIHRLTDLKAKRYFITFEEAVKQIKRAIRAKPGSIIYKKSKVIKIIDLVRAIRPDAEIEITHLGRGEKVMEKIDYNDDGIYEFYTVAEIRELLNKQNKKENI